MFAGIKRLAEENGTHLRGAGIEEHSVVTVGETDSFLDRGGMIALTAERNRVRIHINPSLLRAANLDVSSKLLRIAEVKP